MTSPRRKEIKWRKWKRKNPEKADAAQLRKIMRLVSTGSCFTRKAKLQYLRAFEVVGIETNPFLTPRNPLVLIMPYGEPDERFGYRLLSDDDGYRIRLNGDDE